jgi:hypothetical protein
MLNQLLGENQSAINGREPIAGSLACAQRLGSEELHVTDPGQRATYR